MLPRFVKRRLPLYKPLASPPKPPKDRKTHQKPATEKKEETRDALTALLVDGFGI